MTMYNFGAGKLVVIPTADVTGATIATPTPVILGALQDISVDISVDTKTLYGNKRFPLAVAQGKGKIELKAKYAQINGGVLGSLFLGRTPSAGIRAMVSDFPIAIPANPGPYTVTVSPPNSGDFVADMGIVGVTTGAQYERVASAPATGQYSVDSEGAYTFAAADQGKALLVSYEYTATSTSGQIYTLDNETMGSSPSFSILLQSTHDRKSLVLKLNRATSSKLALPLKSEDFTVMDFDAQAYADADNQIGYICLF